MAGKKGKSGGYRVGAGRKPQGAAILSLHGGRVRPYHKLPEATPTVPQVVVNCPEGLAEQVKAVWDELAPAALEAGTLTPRTRSAFELFCRNVVLERRYAESDQAGTGNHRGMLQWVAARYKDFAIMPFGRPVLQAEAKPVDPFSEFDQVAQ